MPVNLIDIQTKLKTFSTQAKAHKESIATRRQEASDLVRTFAQRLDEIRLTLSRAAEVIPKLRCAVPVDEALDLVVPKPDLPDRFTVLAVDGSQINPSRHARVAFCVINIGLVKMVRGSGQAPEVHTQSQLLDYDAVFNPNGGMISEALVALQRDLREREALLEGAEGLVLPAISMTDGPLELHREPQESAEFSKSLDRYLSVLGELRNKNVITMGYVDKPGSELISRLLELVELSEEALNNYNQRQRRFAGVSDIDLIGHMLQNPGDRSAIFAIHSQTARRFTGDLALHFFYLNVGLPGRPQLARVEVPGWVAREKNMVGLIQAVLTEQASMMGTRPYPYLLHRAHEVALVSLAEHQHVEEMLVGALQHRGISVDEGSHKQYLKDLSTQKTRYEG